MEHSVPYLRNDVEFFKEKIAVIRHQLRRLERASERANHKWELPSLQESMRVWTEELNLYQVKLRRAEADLQAAIE